MITATALTDMPAIGIPMPCRPSLFCAIDQPDESDDESQDRGDQRVRCQTRHEQGNDNRQAADHQPDQADDVHLLGPGPRPPAGADVLVAVVPGFAAGPWTVIVLFVTPRSAARTIIVIVVIPPRLAARAIIVFVVAERAGLAGRRRTCAAWNSSPVNKRSGLCWRGEILRSSTFRTGTPTQPEYFAPCRQIRSVLWSSQPSAQPSTRLRTQSGLDLAASFSQFETES